MEEVLKADDDKVLDLFGLIDFGDSCYGCYVFELAILIVYMMTYAMKQGSTEYLSIAKTTYTAYNEAIHLSVDELDVLYECILMRLCTSIAHSFKFSEMRPDNNEYISSDTKETLMLLEKLDSLEKEKFIQILTF